MNQIGVIQGIEHKIGVWSDRLTETETDLSAQEAIISSPFAKQAELDAKTSRFNEVMSILNPKDEQVIGDEGDVQYQARKYLSDEATEFANDIDEWNRDGRPKGETFILGSTGDVLQGLGAIESDVYMLSDKINTIFREHPEITIKEIKSLPEILENPVLVLASKNAWEARENTRLAIFGMAKAQNGLPILAMFDLRPAENKVFLHDMQKVTSAYTKKKSPRATLNMIESSEVLYTDKEKTTSLLHSVGFQHAYSVERSGFIGNISYVDKTVNITGKKFSDIFTDTQHQQRTSPLTDREVLSIAASEVNVEGLTDGERDARAGAAAALFCSPPPCLSPDYTHNKCHGQYFYLISIISVPTTMSARPNAAFLLKCSLNTNAEKPMETRILSLSMGTTTLARPSCNAL